MINLLETIGPSMLLSSYLQKYFVYFPMKLNRSATRRFDNLVGSFKVEASKIANAVENEKRRAIGYRLMYDALRKKKEEEKQRLTVISVLFLFGKIFII